MISTKPFLKYPQKLNRSMRRFNPVRKYLEKIMWPLELKLFLETCILKKKRLEWFFKEILINFLSSNGEI